MHGLLKLDPSAGTWILLVGAPELVEFPGSKASREKTVTIWLAIIMIKKICAPIFQKYYTQHYCRATAYVYPACTFFFSWLSHDPTSTSVHEHAETIKIIKNPLLTSIITFFQITK